MDCRRKIEIGVEFGFEVVFTRDVFNPENTALSDMLPPQRSQLLPFIDSGLLERQPELEEKILLWCDRAGDRITPAAPVQVVPGGEGIKNAPDIIDRTGRIIRDAGLCRHSYILIVGGGAVLDAIGFAASVAHRGIRHIRLPTTVLSQSDSGMGVKNGINRFGVKNFYGSFYPPAGIVVDVEFLRTLDDRHWRGGSAEAFKVAVIKDRQFLDYLVKHASRIKSRCEDVMAVIIRRCAMLHLEHISGGGDAFERGSQRPLDFGHWAAHWLESATDNEMSHGEAVAVGMAVDLNIAVRYGLLKRGEAETILDAMEEAGLHVWHEKLMLCDSGGRPAVMEGLEQFRQHLGGRLTVAMPDGPGRKRDIHEIDEICVGEAIEQLAARHKRNVY